MSSTREVVNFTGLGIQGLEFEKLVSES